MSEGRDLDLTGIAERLRALNPEITKITVEPPQGANALVRIVIETTRAELDKIGGRLQLRDPELEGAQLETTIKFLDQKPGERIKVQMRRRGKHDA
jgi:hypothetical protein